MKREIIFRGKRVDDGEWMYGYLLSCREKELFYITEGIGANGIEVIPETVSQFTGLTDKNGNPIYEGDRLIQNIKSEFLDVSDWEQVEGNVSFIDGQWCVGNSKYPLYAFENKIIGNIHE